LAILPILVVMVVAATFMVTARLTGIAVRDHWRRPAAVDVAVVSGAGVVGSIVFRVGALIFDVRNLVAYGGITIGGAMTASTLTGRRFADHQAGRPRSRAGSSSTRQAGHRRRGPPGGR
jgi:putative ABC transport system permease protein